MINHFRTWLLNRPAAFFEESLFPVHVDPSFTPSPWNTVTREIDRILFGANPDASLLDYRFFQFLRVIGACRFRDHVRRFDPRETYRPDLGEFHHDSLYASSVVPAQGLSVTEEHTPEFLRKTLTVLVQEDRMIVSGDDGRPVPVTLLSSKSVRIDSLGLVLSAARDGFWRVDYRKRPGRPLGDLVREIDDLPVTVLKSLFDQTKETAPEYEEGFRTITDSLSRFCMVLFACTVAQERMRHDWDKAPKRIEQEAVDLSGDAPGTTAGKRWSSRSRKRPTSIWSGRPGSDSRPVTGSLWMAC